MPPTGMGGTQPAAQLPDGSKVVSDRSAGRSRRCRAGSSPPAGAEAAAELGPERIGCIDPGLSGSRPESPFYHRKFLHWAVAPGVLSAFGSFLG